jgi:hypothetical protein
MGSYVVNCISDNRVSVPLLEAPAIAVPVAVALKFFTNAQSKVPAQVAILPVGLLNLQSFVYRVWANESFN